MKLETIMVPYDGSEHAKRAIEYAKGLSALAGDGCSVRVVHVMPSGMIDDEDLDDSGLVEGVPLGLVSREVYQALTDKAAARELARVRESLQGVIAEGDSATIEVVVDPCAVDAIVYYARQHDVDLVVMGRRGCGALRGMLGSVSYGVLHGVDVPVLTVK